MQYINMVICGTIAKTTAGNLVNEDNGLLSIKFNSKVNGKLVYRVNGNSEHTVAVNEGVANIPTNTLKAGALRAELFSFDPASKILCEPLEITSYFEQNKNRFCANAFANDILERLVNAEKTIEDMKADYAQKYDEVTRKYEETVAKLDEQQELLAKINKSYGLGLFE